MDGESNLCDFFGESELCDTNNLSSATADDDIFSILEALENSCCDNYYKNPGVEESGATGLSTDTTINGDEESGSKESFEFQISAHTKMSNNAAIGNFQESETEAAAVSPKLKRQKLNSSTATTTATPYGNSHDHQYQLEEEGQQRISHITVERNRRKQMNQHLTVLRSLMPCFYVKRGDQASIIGGVVDYINELQQVLQSLESKKQRKSYTEVILSPRPSPLSPRKPPLSPRLSLPISPRTPQPNSPYKPPPCIIPNHQQTFYLNSPSLPSPVDPSPCNSSTSSINDTVNELVATSKSALAEVEVKFSGTNLLLSTVSHRIPGQVIKIISVLEELALEILRINISTVDEKMLNSFTIKIGIECQLSAEELAQQIQQTFCSAQLTY